MPFYVYKCFFSRKNRIKRKMFVFENEYRIVILLFGIRFQIILYSYSAILFQP